MTKINLDYKEFVLNIKTKIVESQYRALKTVNKELIELYWNIGCEITLKQNKNSWGKSIVENLSYDLQKEFPGIKGFSARNLWNMKQFYDLYSKNEKLQPMVAEISWAKNILIMEKCKDDLQREFYIKMTKRFGWTKNVLRLQIENQNYEKSLTNQNNFKQNLSKKMNSELKLALKDEYTFDFLELGDKFTEKELENALVNHVKKFLCELNSLFTFVGSQYKIEIDDEEYFIDILLFHRKLKSLVAVELKIGDFKPEYVGKMNFYLSVLNDKVKMEDENPSIGIILCKDKNRTTVEYSLKDTNKPMGVSTYTITKSLPKEFEGLLPSPEEIQKQMGELD